MSMDQMLSVFSALIAFLGLISVALQMRAATKQRRIEALTKVYDINRELLSLGFAYPELFQILTADKGVDPQNERRYLQMWLNQLALIHSHLEQGGFDPEFGKGLEREIADFFCLPNMRRHWQLHGSFYGESFQVLVNGVIARLEAQS